MAARSRNENGAGFPAPFVAKIASWRKNQAAAVLDASVGTEAMVFRMREAIW